MLDEAERMTYASIHRGNVMAPVSEEIRTGNKDREGPVNPLETTPSLVAGKC